MLSDRDKALVSANDFLRTFLADLDRGEKRASTDIWGRFPASDPVLSQLWNELHRRAAPGDAMPSTERLSAAGRRLAAEPDSLQELVDRALRERTATLPPTLIPGYELIEEIGRGGQGRVYRARDLRLDRVVAIKLLRHGASPDELRRLRREGLIAARIDDPCVCRALEVGECDHGVYVAMQFVAGETLAMRIAASKRAVVDLPADDRVTGIGAVLGFVERMARALDRMHGAGVLHRDIKPGNVMVAEDGRPVILDLGLARTDDDVTLTRADTVLGTLDYMAPELLEHGPGPGHDPRTEVWSLGVVLFECLTGRRPFGAATRAGLTEAIRRAPLPADVLRKMPRDLRAVLETALDHDRERRYQTAGAFADDLAHLRRREPVMARPMGPLLRLRRAAQRRPAAAVALVSAVVLPTIWAVQAQAGERRATRYLGETLGAVESMLVQLAGVELEDMPRGAILRQQLLEDAATRYRRLAEDDRLSDDVDRSLARVEVELARLAMEQDELDAALGYVVGARRRIATHRARAPDDAVLLLADAGAALRHAEILIRRGNPRAALEPLQTTVHELARLAPTDAVNTLRIDALALLADAHRRMDDLDAALRVLDQVLAATQRTSTPTHQAASVSWLAIAELHRVRGDCAAMTRALEASETAIQEAIAQTPMSRYLMGVFCLQQLYRADMRVGDPNRAVVSAYLQRSSGLLSELGSVFPHWRQVDILRWQECWRQVRHAVECDQPDKTEAFVERALTDLDTFGDALHESRELLLVACAVMTRIADVLPPSEAYARAREAATARANRLQREVARRHPDVDAAEVVDAAAWLTIRRLRVLHRQQQHGGADHARLTPSLARTASTALTEIGLRLAKQGDGAAALRRYEAAQHIMAAAYARNPITISRRYLYYAMERRTRQLMLLGRWREAADLRAESMPHFLAEAARRAVDLQHQFWLVRGPTREVEPLISPECAVDPALRVRFASFLAEAIAFLDQDARMAACDDRLVIRSELAATGRALVEAALAAGWQTDRHPSEHTLLGVLYR